jgi:hypothetical protein
MANRSLAAGLRSLGRKYSVTHLIAVAVATFSALHSYWLAIQLAKLRDNCGEKSNGWSSLSTRNKQSRDKVWLQIVIGSSPTTSKHVLRTVQSLVDELPTSNDVLFGKVTILVISYEDVSDGFDQVYS